MLTGIDVLVRDNFAPLKGRRVGLVTNHTGIDRQGRTTIDLLHKADGVKLVALFSPEHGIRGALDEQVADGRDEKTGLPIYSLYGTRRKPTAETLKGIDTLVFDIQDAGCRFYTYISTLGLVMEAAAENKVRVVVLDRPNPIGGKSIEGPMLDTGKESFVGYHILPIRHGLTIGELALLFNAEKKLGCDLHVVKMEGWRRGDLFDRTGLHWVNPSPNLRSLTEALLYPGVGLLETTNVSVGRGTDRPFEWIGAPWLDGERLAAALAQHRLPGVRFLPLKLTPTSSTHQGKQCGGVQIMLDDWSSFQPLRTGMALASELQHLYPTEWQIDKYQRLLGNQATFDALKRGAMPVELETLWQKKLGLSLSAFARFCFTRIELTAEDAERRRGRKRTVLSLRLSASSAVKNSIKEQGMKRVALLVCLLAYSSLTPFVSGRPVDESAASLDDLMKQRRDAAQDLRRPAGQLPRRPWCGRASLPLVQALAGGREAAQRTKDGANRRPDRPSGTHDRTGTARPQIARQQAGPHR